MIDRQSAPSPRDAETRFAARRQQMVEHQLIRRGVTDNPVVAAMGEVPRHAFVPPEQVPEAYEDEALPIGHGQTISQPYMVGYMLQQLQVEAQHRVLEVGAGSGYQASLLGHLAREVYAIEISPPLAERAREVVGRLGYGNVHIITGDGGLGYAPAAPFDRIIVAAACPTIPQPLVDQLVEGGRLVAPVGSRSSQICIVGVKRGGALSVSDALGCVFVPLRGKHGW